MADKLTQLDALRINEPTDIKAAAAAFKSYVEQMADLVIGPCHNIATMEPMRDADGLLLGEHVFEWTDRERRVWIDNPKVVLDSPLITACRYESEVFWANGDGFHSRTTTRYLDCLDLDKFERRTGVRSAIVCPIHLPMGQIGVVFFIPKNRSRRDLTSIFFEAGETLSIASRAFVSSYARVHCSGIALPSRLKLSFKEVECLQWAAYGKTDQEIGIITERSACTIRFHIQNASRKLDTVNRGQTIYKAAQLGFIGIN